MLHKNKRSALIVLLSVLIFTFVFGYEKYIPDWAKNNVWEGKYSSGSNYVCVTLKSDTLTYYEKYQSGEIVGEWNYSWRIFIMQDSNYYFLGQEKYVLDNISYEWNEEYVRRFQQTPFNFVRINGEIALEILDEKNCTFGPATYLFPKTKHNLPKPTYTYKKTKLYGYSVGDTLRNYSGLSKSGDDNIYCSYNILDKDDNRTGASLKVISDSIITEINYTNIPKYGNEYLYNYLNEKFESDSEHENNDTTKYSRWIRYYWNNYNVVMRQDIGFRNELTDVWHMYIIDLPYKWYVYTFIKTPFCKFNRATIIE